MPRPTPAAPGDDTHAFLNGRHRLYIDGRWTQGAGRAIDVENPATESSIATVRAASLAQLDEAVA